MDTRTRSFALRARRLAAVTAVALAATAPGAAAQTAQDGYSAPGGNVQNDVQGNQSTGSPTTRAGTVQQSQSGSTTLPFSGLDVVFLLGAGVGLCAVGAGLRRMTTGEHPGR